MTKASSWVSRVWRGRRDLGVTSKTNQRRAVRTRRVFFEPLEDRRLLATITVTSLADNMIVDGQVTLREAIEAANTNTSVDGSVAGTYSDEIVFQSGLMGTIDLNGTELTVERLVTIVGPGQQFLTIDAHDNSRHFRVTEQDGMTLDGVTLTRGSVVGNGGSILSDGTLSLTIRNSVIHGNSATNGGGIYSVASINVINSTIADNVASGSGGGIFVVPYTTSVSGSVSLIASTISGNSAATDGGGVRATGSVRVIVSNSTISGNVAGSSGGGIRLQTGRVQIGLSTIVRNRVTATDGQGGGIYMLPNEGYTPDLTNSIIAQNEAALSPDLTLPTDMGTYGPIIYNIIGNNAGTYLAHAPVGTPDAGGNLIGEPGAMIDPKVAPLADNGGPTKTHALLLDSPAIDAGGTLGAAALLDQRGYPKVNRRDIGAFELTPPLAFFDDGTIKLQANNPAGFAERPAPVFHNSMAVGNQPYQAIELYHHVLGTSSYPLVFVDLVANLFSRIAYTRADGAAVNFGTSTVGSASFRTNSGFNYVPTVSRADVTTGGASSYQSVVTANFGNLANVTSTKSFLTPVIGQSSNTVAVEFEALQDITLATGTSFTSNDRLRLFTASSMFNDESNFDADVLRYEDANGNIQTLVLKDITPTNAYLFPSAVEIGSWFELVKTGGSAWFPDSPTIRVTIDDKHGLRLGLQGYLLQSDDNNDDSLSVWLEWLDAPNTVTAGTTLNLDVTVTATPPGTPGIAVSETDGNTVVSEDGTNDTFTVALAAQPRSNVVIDVTSSNTDEATVSPASLTFTPANWDQPQSVTVTGIPDSQIDGDQASTTTLQINQAASDVEYRPVANRTVSVTTTDIDQPESPTITWDAPDDVTYGTLLNDTQLNATASVAGTFVYSPASGAVLNAGLAQQLSVTFTPDDTIHYQQVTAFVSINVLKADTTIVWNNPADLVFGSTLDDVQLNAVGSVPGTFVYTPAHGTVLNAGNAQSISVVFTPNDTANYNTATATVAINVRKADPVITWSNPADITYGALLDNNQLNATANVPGTFAYLPASGARLNAGEKQSLSVTFTPADTLNYTEVTANVSIDVLKADPLITWDNPADNAFGSQLGETELNATADISGTFSYDPASGTQLEAGAEQQLNVNFVPTDTANFNPATATVFINILKAVPTIHWSNPRDVEFGTLLTRAQLNATVNMDGTFDYSPAMQTRLDAGTDLPLQVTFTPTDTVNFQTVTKTVTINVAPADSFITWNVSADITYGTLLDDTQLNAVGDKPGSYVYTPAHGAQLSAGNAQQLQVTFTPEDTNFKSVTTVRLLNVLKANPLVTWDEPADIQLGTALGVTQLNATADIPGAFAYAPAIGTQLNAGANLQLSVTFTPTDAANFNTVTKIVVITVLAPIQDFGDAPSDYPATLAQNGARHTTGSLFLGSSVDAEADGQPSSDASGDGADEDGVLFVASLVATSGSTTTSSFAVNSSGAGKLDAWIDFNLDSDWDDAGEQIFTSKDVTAGVNLLRFGIPAGATPGMTAVRFRLSSVGGLTPTGAAADGEVEDYMATILDGDATGGATIAIKPSMSGALDVIADGNDVVVRRGTIELFRAPGAKLNRLDMTGTSGDDTLNLANLDAIFAGLIGFNAGAGSDTLRLTGSGHILDLTSIDNADIQGLETIDITGDGDNTLTIDFSKVVDLSPTTGRLRIVHDDGDVVNYSAGWSVELPEIVAGQFVQVLDQNGAKLEVDNTTPFRNPFRRFDANRDGDVSPLDVLVIVNRLNIAGPGPLSTPTFTVGLTEYFYIDINGDRSVSPIDVLQIINFLNSPTSSAEGETTGIRRDQEFMTISSSSSFDFDAVTVRRQKGSSGSTDASSTVVRPQPTIGIATNAARVPGSRRPTNANEDGNLFRAIDTLFASTWLA